MKTGKRFRRNKGILPLFISLIIILSFIIFVSVYVITNNSSNEQNLNENSNPIKLGNLLQNQNVNPSLDLDDLIFYHIFDSTSYGSKGSGSSSSSSSSLTSEADNLDNPTEDSTTDSVNGEIEDSETNPDDSSNSIDNEADLDDSNPQTSEDKKSKLIDDENEDFIDVIVVLKDDEVSDEMLGIAIDSPLEKKLSEIKSIVKTKQDKVLSTLDSSEFLLKHKYKTVSGFAGKITQEGLAKLKQDPNVEAIYEDEMLHITLTESVPLINADDVHNLGITGEGTVVCVVDTGIDYTHPNLGNCTDVYEINGNVVLDNSSESPHPYDNYYNETWIITKPGFSQIAVHFSDIDVEGSFDKVYIKDANNNIVQTFTGYYEDVWSVSVPGDTIKINFVTDYSVTGWGFAIDKVLDGTATFSLENCEKVIDGYDFVNNDNDPVDDDSHGTHVAGIVAANGSIPLNYTDTVGSWVKSWIGQNRGRGNNWYASEDVTLTEIEMYLGISSSTTLYWFVYENPTATGDFTKIFETSTTSSTGQKFYRSGTINVELEAGKYYLIGAWWGSTSVTYGRGTESVPFDVSFGKLQTGLYSSLTGSTPPDTWSFTYSNYPPYYSRIITSTTPLRGVAPDAELVAVKVCNAYGGCPGSAMIAGVDWCNDKKEEYNIVATTMSIGDGGQYNSTNCPTWMDNVVNRAHDLDIAVTVASGNEGWSNGISYPACSPNAISVGAVYDANVGARTWCIRPWCTETCRDATTFTDKIVCFTNTGPLLDLLAPGSVITSTKLGGGYIGMSGTSMATPHVAGAIALAKQFLPSASPDEIVDVLKTTGKPIIDPDNNLTFSRIDLLAASNYSECSSNSDCGNDSYVGEPFCQNDNVWQDYITYTCMSNVLCSNSTDPMLIDDCGEDYCEDWQDNYCKDGDVYHKRICYDKGCFNGGCYNNSYEDEQKAQECPNGCVEDEGRCLVEVCETICNFGKCYEYCVWE